MCVCAPSTTAGVSRISTAAFARPGATSRLTKAISCARPAALVCLAFPTSTSQPAVLSFSRFPARRLFSDLEVHTRPRLPNITKFRPGSRASVASAGGRYLCAQSLPLRTVAFAWTTPACIGGCSVPSSHCSIVLAPPPPPPPPREVSSS